MVHFCRSPKSLVGKTTIITGANTGIGYETALDFAKRGARVILACRSQEKADAAREKIVAATGNENVVVKLIDMESFDSVRLFAKEFLATEDRLDILVNNAGALLPEKMTKDNLQLGMQVNYFSPFLLTHLLLDLLKKCAPSRIINVSSQMAQFLCSFELKDINEYPGSNVEYARNKLCQILQTQEMARRLQGTGVTIYSLHPGAVNTEFQRFSSILTYFAKKIFNTPEEGAQTQIYLSVQDGIEELSGQHFHDSKPVKAYCAARDDEKAKKLYEMSLELCGLNANDEVHHL